MSYTNGPCRIRVKNDCHKMVFDVHGCDGGNVSCSYENGTFSVLAKRGKLYNYAYNFTLDDPSNFNVDNSYMVVERGMATLVVPLAGYIEDNVNRYFSIPVRG